MPTINVNEMAASALSIIQSIQQQAVETVGLETMYFRTTPNKNSEDAVIFQEYTLYNVEDCGHILNIILTDTSYQPGDFTVGLFGISEPPIPEAQIPITEWQNAYGANSQPQRGDIVYIKQLHKLYEVASSTVVCQVQSYPTLYKLSLQKYAPQASRRESQELRESIEEMTVNQADLFGETISDEVADAVVEVETSYNQTSYVSPHKDFDMGSVVTDELIGPSGNRISNAYYDMLIAEQPVLYHTSGEYDPECDEPYWLFSCWMRSSETKKQKEHSVRKLELYFKDNHYWYFKISSTLRLNEGMKVTLSRGSLISMTGDVVPADNCQTIQYLVRFRLADMQQANNRLKDWWASGTFKISVSSEFNVISTDNDTFRLTVHPDKNTIFIKFGQFEKDVNCPLSVEWDLWSYLGIALSPSGAHVFLEQLSIDAAGKYYTENRMDEDVPANVRKPGKFEFSNLLIDSVRTPLNIRNIRLYENQYPIDESAYMLDAMSEVTRNASKLIITDAPNIKTSADFYSPAR